MKLASAIATLACGFVVCWGKCSEPSKPRYTYTGCEWQLTAGAPDDSTCPTYAIKCDDSVDQACFQRVDSGQGTAIRLRYHFDPRYNRCFPFPYGGSGGNANNFETRAVCAERCKPAAIDTESPTDNNSGSVQLPSIGTASSCAAVLCPVNSRCENGRCVPFGSLQCGDNEEIKNCGACDATCDNLHIMCSTLCGAPACGCKSDFVRDASNKCVARSSCSSLSTQSPLGACATVKCTGGTTCVEGVCVKKDNANICGPNAHYDECGSACPAVCGSELFAANCFAVCKPSCVCDIGFVLDRPDGSCIRREDCQRSSIIVSTDKCTSVLCASGNKCLDGVCVAQSQDEKCPVNMHYESCGTACPARCGGDINAQICTDICKPGCFCDSSFVLDSDGTCVRRQHCKPQHDNCATVRCQAGYQCTDGECVQRKDCPVFKLKAAPVGCTYEGAVNAQGCKEWSLRCDGSSVSSVSSNATSCGPNAEVSDCASLCPATCENRDSLIACPAVCKQGCVCKPGYIFKSSNLQDGCVSKDECSLPQRNPITPSGLRCGENEIEKQCGACDSYCNQQTRACSDICHQPECGCIAGYRRNNQNKCVAEAECNLIGDCSVMLCIPGTTCTHGQCVPNKTCGVNEEFKDCGTACEPTCDNQKPEICTTQCVVNVCQCQQGFVRHNGSCIEPSNC